MMFVIGRKRSAFEVQFHLIVVSIFFKTCVKHHGNSTSRFPERRIISMYRSALVGGFVNISVHFNKKANNFETAR